VPFYREVTSILCSHERSTCDYAHNFNDYRRDPLRFKYDVIFYWSRWETVLIGIRIKPLILSSIVVARNVWIAPNVTAGSRPNTILIISWKPIMKVMRKKWIREIYPHKKIQKILVDKYVSCKVGWFRHRSSFLSDRGEKRCRAKSKKKRKEIG
jgi:hypothetical protein